MTSPVPAERAEPAEPAEPAESAERPYRRLSPLTPVVRSALLLVAVLLSSWDSLLQGQLGPLGWVLLALLVGGLLAGALSWVRTKYWIEGDELRVDTGILSRQSRRIRVDRLQGIDIVQPFVARLLGLAELRMDVAGGGRGEGTLAFLRLREAQDLREILLARRDAALVTTAPTAPPSITSPVPAATAAAPGAGSGTGSGTGSGAEQVIGRLDLRTLMVSIVLSHTTLAFLASAALLIGDSVRTGAFGTAAGLLPIVVGFAVTLVRRLSGFFGFTVSTGPTGSGPGLQIRRGLLGTSTQTVPLARVQGVVVAEPWMWSRLGWARLDVSVAGHAGGESGGQPEVSTVMPVAPRAEVLALARTVLSACGSPDPAAVVLTAPPRRARWVAPVRRRFLASGFSEDLVVTRAGVLVRRTHVVPHARVQSLQLHQRPWQRLLGLADVRVDSPPGPVAARARHRDATEARALVEELSVLTRRARRVTASS